MPQRISTTTKPRSFRWAYLLNENTLRRLDQMLKEDVLNEVESSLLSGDEPKELDYQVGFSDGSYLHTSSVDEVANLPNSRDRRITSLRISEPFWLTDLRVRVSFTNSRSLPSVEYEVRGEASKALHLADKLDQELPAIRQWYSLITKVSFTLIAVIAIVAIFTILSVMDTVNPSEPDPLQASWISIAVALLFYPVIFFVGVFLDWLRNILFPVATFAIGQGVARAKYLNSWRIFLGITLGAGLIVEVVGGFIT